MTEKRVKSGLALTPEHLKLCDENLARASVRSRNDFVEQAIEFYAAFLTNREYPRFATEGYDTPLMSRFETLSKSLGTGQYKMAVELATVARLLSLVLNVSNDELREIQADSRQEVKHLGSVPTFQKCYQRQREGNPLSEEQ